MELTDLLREAAERRATDVHFVAGEPPIYRVQRELERSCTFPALQADDLNRLLLPALPESTRFEIENGTQSLAKTLIHIPEITAFSFQLTVFRSEGGIGATARALLDQIPTLEDIAGSAMPLLRKITNLRRGLTLFTGPTGSGRSTTAAAVVDTINRERGERIFVVGDMSGYIWRSKKSIVTSWLMGRDYESYEHAGEVLLRGADPDVIFFEDLPTPEAARLALILADIGNFVVAAVGAPNAVEAIAQLVRALPEPREGAQELLARTLVAVFHQQLLVRSDGRGRLAAYEALFATASVRNIIRSGASAHELRDALEQGDAEGSRSLSAAIEALLASHEIDTETANRHRPDHGASIFPFTPPKRSRA